MNKKLFFMLIFMFAGVSNVFAEAITGPKFGYVDWGQKTVNIDGTELEFTNSNGMVRPLGVEFNYVFDSGLAVGGEFIYQELGVRRSSSGSANVYRYMALTKYYFPEMDIVRPFMGVSAGLAEISIHGAETEPNARLSGSTYAGIAGMDLKLGHRVGLSLEYRRAHLRMRDNSSEINSANNEFFMRISFYSGH